LIDERNNSDDNNDGAAACVLGAKRSNHPNWLRHSFRWHKSPEMKGVGLGWAVLSIKPYDDSYSVQPLGG